MVESSASSGSSEKGKGWLAASPRGSVCISLSFRNLLDIRLHQDCGREDTEVICSSNRTDPGTSSIQRPPSWVSGSRCQAVTAPFPKDHAGHQILPQPFQAIPHLLDAVMQRNTEQGKELAAWGLTMSQGQAEATRGSKSLTALPTQPPSTCAKDVPEIDRTRT